MSEPKNLSIVKAFSILRSFGPGEAWVSAAELSRRAHLPASSGYRLIQTLEEIGAITRAKRGCYKPGLLLKALSKTLTVREVLAEVSIDVVQALATKTGATTHLGLFEDGMVTYVAKAQGRRRVKTPAVVGAQSEAYCTALGKVLLAALSEDELDCFLKEGEFVALTDHTIVDPLLLRREIDAVRQHQFALDHEETCLGVDCVAVPVRDSKGGMVAALSLADRTFRMFAASPQGLLPLLRDAAATIASRIDGEILERARAAKPDL